MPTMKVNQQTNWVSHLASSVNLCTLVLCLLLSQTLGFMHGIEHAPRSDHPNHKHNTQSEAAASGSIASVASIARIHWIADLFAGHSEESTCQVFDQLSNGSALLGHASDIAHLRLTSFFIDTYRDATPAFQRSLVQARGPPSASTLV